MRPCTQRVAPARAAQAAALPGRMLRQARQAVLFRAPATRSRRSLVGPVRDALPHMHQVAGRVRDPIQRIRSCCPQPRPRRPCRLVLAAAAGARLRRGCSRAGCAGPCTVAAPAALPPLPLGRGALCAAACSWRGMGLVGFAGCAWRLRKSRAGWPNSASELRFHARYQHCQPARASSG